jgi:ribosome modulation factor
MPATFCYSGESGRDSDVGIDVQKRARFGTASSWRPKLTGADVVAILAIFAAPLYAQAQQPSTDKLKAEARDFAKIISDDKLKSQTYCKIVELNDQIDQEEDPVEVQELSQKRDKLEEKLGRQYVALVAGVMGIDKDSRDYQQIASILEPLDKLCED